ncbi:MAG: helix-turn-helix domain-containing protein [Peptococcaceae bacterium]|nr:helix-turn-helix domain-containing protein [Peptococcaceae bacterium]
MEFSSYLKDLIKKRGYSYRKLGQLSGVNHTYISKICGGYSSTPSPEILRKLAVPLFVPYEELLKAAGYLLGEGKTAYPAGAEEELVLRVARLTPEAKERLLEFLDFLEDWEKKQRRKRKGQEKRTP